MADKVFYTKNEVDKILDNIKDRLFKQVDEQIEYGPDDAKKPTYAKKTLSLKIIKKEK